MYKTFITTTFACYLSASLAFAQELVLDSETQVDEYIASVEGSLDCTMPADPNNPQAGDCKVTKSQLVTGWKLVKVGDQCYREETNLIEWVNFLAAGGLSIDAPKTTFRRVTVNCPG